MSKHAKKLRIKPVDYDPLHNNKSTVREIETRARPGAAMSLYDRLSTAKIARIDAKAPKITDCECIATWVIQYSDEARAGFAAVCAEIGNVQTLYHGTPPVNVLSIARTGLKRGRSGAMFGSGIYLGDTSKALGFAGDTDNVFYLIEVRVALGKICEFDAFDHAAHTKMRLAGCNSVGAFAGRCASYYGALRHSEWVIYNPEQVFIQRIYEYQRTRVKETAQIIQTGDCAVAIDVSTRNPKLAKFGPLWKRCAANTATRVKTSDNFTYYVCKSCIDRLNLQKGTTFTVIRGYSKPWCSRRSSGGDTGQPIKVRVVAQVQ